MNPSPLEAEKTIVLTFDDFWSTHVNFVFPELVKRGLRATFFVPHEAFVPGAWEGRLADPRQHLRRFHDAGMEIGAHYYHGGAKFECTINESDREIVECGVPQPVTFCYPGFIFPAKGLTPAQVKERYSVARLGVNEWSDKSRGGASGPAHDLDADYLQRTLCTGIIGRNYDLREFEKDLETKVNGRNVGVFCFHSVGHEVGPKGKKGRTYEFPEERFTGLLDMIVERNDVAVICLRELAALEAHPILAAPYRSPRVVASEMRPYIEGKSVCELGAAHGDHLMHMLWDGGARSVCGDEIQEHRARDAVKRGMNVRWGSFFDEEPPLADVYYSWISAKINPMTVDYMIGLNKDLTLIIGANTRGELRELEKSRKQCDGKIIKFSYNEGDGGRQRGSFHLLVANLNPSERGTHGEANHS